MAASEWTCSVRAVWDTLGADDSVSGINPTGCIAYHTVIPASPFVIALLVSYLERSVEILIARSLYILKYRYIHGLLYAVVRVCLCMSCTHACALSWHLQLCGISSWVWNDHHLRQIIHQPNLSHTTGGKPYMQHAHSGFVSHRDHTSELVHWVRSCFGSAMR